MHSALRKRITKTKTPMEYAQQTNRIENIQNHYSITHPTYWIIFELALATALDSSLIAFVPMDSFNADKYSNLLLTKLI